MKQQAQPLPGLFIIKYFIIFSCLGYMISCCASHIPHTNTLFTSDLLPSTVVKGAPEIKDEILVQQVHRLINRIRKEHGLPVLTWSEDLAMLAQSHSTDMAQNRYFGHRNIAGEEPHHRAERLGLSSDLYIGDLVLSGIGENLLLTHLYTEYTVYEHPSGVKTYDVVWKNIEELADQSVRDWMNSPAHRANILSDCYSESGIGIAFGENQTIFITHNFKAGNFRQYAGYIKP